MEDDFDVNEVKTILQTFLSTHHENELLDILLSENEGDHYAVNINALDLFDANMLVSSQLLKTPLKIIPIFDSAAFITQEKVMEKYQISQSTMTLKRNIHVRVSNLPMCPELVREKLPRCDDVGTFLAVTGEEFEIEKKSHSDRDIFEHSVRLQSSVIVIILRYFEP